MKNLAGFDRRPICIAACVIMSLGSAAVVFAQEGILEEVVVTAQFRKERLQDTPLAITAVSDDMMRARSQLTIDAIATQAPNVELRPAANAFGPALNGFIRGIGQDDFNLANEPGVGMYIDDVYYSTLTGTDFQLLDLERVEVLRGPQGTLQGRNSIGGSIRMITRKPTGEGGAFVEATYGDFNHINARAAAGFTVIPDQLFVRFSAVTNNETGYQDRLDFACDQPVAAAAHGIKSTNQGRSDCKLGTLGGSSYAGGRASLRWTPNDRLEVNVSGDLTHDNSEAAALGLASATATTVNSQFGQFGPWFVSRSQSITYENFIDPAGGGSGGLPLSFDPINEFIGWGVSGVIDYRINDWLSFKSVTSYRKFDSRFGSSTDGSPLSYGEFALNNVSHDSIQQEGRLNGTLFGDTVDFTAGSFFFHQNNLNTARVDIRYLPFIPVGSFDFLSDQTVDATSIAGFGHVVWHVNDRLNLTGGIRYTHEEKIQTESRLDSDTLQPSANPAFADFAAQGGSLTSTFTGSRLDYRFSADYRWADQLMTYFTFSTGFKSGGSNPRPFFGSQFLPFDEETVKSFEAGFKSDLFDQRLRLNADYFFALYSDIQLVPLTCDDISPFPSAPCAAPRNLADGQISGVELEATFLPTDHLSIDTSMSYIKLNFTKVDPAAVGPVDPTLDRPENTPTWKASAGAQYEIPMGDWGTLTPRVDVAYEGEKSGLAGTAGLVIDSYTLINARLTWRSADDTWEAAFSATNIGDTEYLYNTFDLTGAGAAWQSTHPAKPREWNFTVRHSF